MRRARLPDRRSPEERRLWEKISLDLARMRKERREAARAAQLPFAGVSGCQLQVPPTEGLKRGVRPDPDRQLCRHGLSTMLTDREFHEFQRQHRRLGRRLTVSTAVRFMICEFLQSQQVPETQEASFRVDRRLLDWRARQPLKAYLQPVQKHPIASDDPQPQLAL